MLDSGIAREMARMVLPINIYTEIYSCWDLKNLIHFIALRDDSHAQSEIQEYAKAIKTICKELFPWTMEVYEEEKAKKK
jgi:thymidylate synthase (FAD)